MDVDKDDYSGPSVDEAYDKLSHPMRTSCDISFSMYRQIHLFSSDLYLSYLKELSESDSRLDYLFFVFDIVCCGPDGTDCTISSEELNERTKLLRNFKDAMTGADSKLSNSIFSVFVAKHFPFTLNDDKWAEKYRLKPNEVFYLSTYRSNDYDLVKYRKECYKELVKRSNSRDVNADVIFNINPLEDTGIEGIYGNKFRCNRCYPRLFYFKPYEKGYTPDIKSQWKKIYEDNKRKAETEIPPEDFPEDMGKYYKVPVNVPLNYYLQKYSYVGNIHGINECMLLDMNEYRRQAIENKLENIVNPASLTEFNDTVLVKTMDSNGQTHFCRGKILDLPAHTPSCYWICFLDYGEYCEIPTQYCYKYEPNECKDDYLTRFVPREDLPRDLQLGDFFIYSKPDNVLTPCGRPSSDDERDNFFRIR